MERKLIKPISPSKWESIIMDAEFPSVGIFCLDKYGDDPEKIKQELTEMAKNVLTLSAEVWRLRMTYGEETWNPVDISDEDLQKERERYEEEIKNDKSRRN